MPVCYDTLTFSPLGILMSVSLPTVGPGTGVAPLRGFLQDRKAAQAPGPNVLFFGCRWGGQSELATV
jgi:hypothetical protein